VEPSSNTACTAGWLAGSRDRLALRYDQPILVLLSPVVSRPAFALSVIVSVNH